MKTSQAYVRLAETSISGVVEGRIVKVADVNALVALGQVYATLAVAAATVESIPVPADEAEQFADEQARTEPPSRYHVASALPYNNWGVELHSC